MCNIQLDKQFMEDIREILNSFSKEDLIELIIENSDNGYYPLDIFLLKADYQFSAAKLKEHWKEIYEQALAYDKQRDDKASDYLRDGAEMCFKQAKKLSDSEQRKSICSELINDLTFAAEEDGIGMYFDSEWIYLDVRDKISDYVSKDFQIV